MNTRKIFIIIITGLLAGAVLAGPPNFPGSTDSYIVVLKEPSVVERLLAETRGKSVKARRELLYSQAARDYQKGLDGRQERLLEGLRGTGGTRSGPATAKTPPPQLEVLARRSFLLNLLVVRSGPEALAYLRRRPEVKAVYPNREQSLHMDAVPAIVNVLSVWEALGGIDNAGRNTRIGIIDTGINPFHPMFYGTGLTAPPGFPQPPESADYTSNKIIVARNYVTTEYGYQQQQVKTPEDEKGHGTAVASIAAGGWATTLLLPIQGMAPKAFLGNYKVFGTPGINESAMTAAVIAALNDATEDQMDVVNMSFGGSPVRPEDDPEQQAIANATAAGVLVVISAGNGGPNTGTVASPGTSPAALTVGATLHSRYFATPLEVTSPDSSLPAGLGSIGYVPAEGQDIPLDTGALPLASIVSADPDSLGCSALPSGSLTGKLALVQRGICRFDQKAAMAINAGALGIVVYQNTSEPPFTMSGDFDMSHLALMIDRNSGRSLEEFLAASHRASIRVRSDSPLSTFPSDPHEMAAFSARGPDISLQIKPDLVAPGQGLLTATSVMGSPSYSYQASGTSFSAPIVTGSAALLFELHPDWSPETVKSSLVNSADPVATDHGQAAGPIKSGNGFLDVQRAAAAFASLSPVSLSFGAVTDEGVIEKKIEMRNVTAVRRTFTAELIEAVPHPAVQLSLLTDSFTLDPGETADVVVQARFRAPLRYGIFEGHVRIGASGTDARMDEPYWGGMAIEDRTALLQVSQTPTTGQFDSLATAIQAAHPGATIEITDEGEYAGGLTIGSNGDGMPLNGLTLRSQPGLTPGLNFDYTGPVLSLSGIDRFTLQGVALRGGLTGLLAQQSSGVLRDVQVEDGFWGLYLEQSQFAIDRVNLKNIWIAGIQAQTSRLNVTDTTIEDSGGQGMILVDSPALIQRSKVLGSAVEGLVNVGASTSVFDSSFENNGNGLNFYSCPALVKGNSITENSGQPPEDGIYADGGTIWAQDNRIAGNSGHGVEGAYGADIEFLRNRVELNQAVGFYLSQASGAVRSSVISNNSRGIRSESSALLVSDSLINGSLSSSEGDGVLADGGVLTLLNSTVAGNRHLGLMVQGSADHLIANSIFHLNSAGDVQGALETSVTSNLIGDGLFRGVAGNIQADPLFTDPAALDFSLKPASPAIDAGNAAFAVSAIDLISHERTIDGNGDAVAKPDLGALEFGSGTSVPLVVPVFSKAANEFVGLALANASAENCQVTLRGYDTEGHPFGNVFQKQIDAGTQFSILLTEALGAVREGWVEIRSDKPDLMSFSLLGDWNLTHMDGAELRPAIASRLLLPEVRAAGSNQTTVFVVNPNPNVIEVSIRWNLPSGSHIRDFHISGHGCLTVPVADAFEPKDGGYITVETKTPAGKRFFAMELFSNGKSLGGLLGIDMDQPAETLYGAQLARTAAVDTVVNVVNLGPAVDLVLEALNESGTVMGSVTFPGLPANGQYRKPASEIFGSAREIVGWVRVSAAGGKLAGSIAFSDPGGNFLASLPLQSQGARESVLAHIAQTKDVFTGVTVLNPSDQPAEVSLEVFDQTGTSKGMSLFELKPLEKRARLIPEYLPGFGEQEAGFVRIRSNIAVVGFELFAHNQLKFMSAVPQQVIVK